MEFRWSDTDCGPLADDAPIRVVVVADDRGQAKRTASHLEDASVGSQVKTATSLATAAAAVHHRPIDCVVSEYRLPDGNGLELLRHVRTATADLPFVLYPRDGSERLASDAVAAGVTEYLPQDGDPIDELARRIEDRVAAYREDRRFRETAARYSALVEDAPAPIIIYDGDHELAYVNQATADLVGADDPGDLVGRTVESFVADDAVDAVTERIDRVVHDREAVAVRQVTVAGENGERRHVRAAGSPVRYEGRLAGQAVLMDDTGRVERERRIRRERDRFTALFESVPEPVVHVVFEDETPIVRNVNGEFESVFGLDGEEIVDEPLDGYVVPDGHAEEGAAINRQAADGQVIEREVERVTADGRRDFLFRAVPFGAGDPPESIGIYVDISDQKARERELGEKNERLDRFATLVSHDLRNPMEVATANVELARETGDLAHLDAAEEALDRMADIVDDVLTLARRGDTIGEIHEVSIAEVAERAASNTALGVDQLEVDESIGRVRADPERLRALFENLFRNSSTHAGEGVTVRVRPLEDGFAVEDDGPGVPSSVRGRVFEPGFSKGDGNGFGLNIVEEIAEAHGWTVSLAAAARESGKPLADGSAASAVETESRGARFEVRGVEVVE